MNNTIKKKIKRKEGQVSNCSYGEHYGHRNNLVVTHPHGHRVMEGQTE